MSSLSVHRAAQEGQTGLVKSLITQDPNIVNSKDAVSPLLSMKHTTANLYAGRTNTAPLGRHDGQLVDTSNHPESSSASRRTR